MAYTIDYRTTTSGSTRLIDQIYTFPETSAVSNDGLMAQWCDNVDYEDMGYACPNEKQSVKSYNEQCFEFEKNRGKTKSEEWGESFRAWIRRRGMLDGEN